MLSKQDHIDYWITGSDEDWQRADWMEQRGDFVFALFCTHLCLEKLCKALWVKENTASHPPKIHDLKYLLSFTSFTPDATQALFLDEIQKYQIEGRYPDYRRLIVTYTTAVYCSQLRQQSDQFRQCLQNTIS